LTCNITWTSELPSPDVDGAVRRCSEPRLERFHRGDLAVARRDAADRLHFAGLRVVLELGANDVIGGHDAGQRRLDHFLRRGGDDEKRELHPVQSAGEEVDERLDAAAQPDAPAGLGQMLGPDAAKRGIVPDQIRKLPSLMDQVARGKAVDLALKIRHAEQVAQDLPESLKLRVWSKSEATRKCLMSVISMSHKL
jgi:hypothetical protein